MYFWKIKECLHFGVLLTVQALVLVSESTLRFALPLYLLNVSGSPSLYGVATAVAFVPSVLLMPAAGVVADRVDMRRILVIAGSVLVLCSACYLFLFRAHLLVMTILFLVTLYAVHALYIPMFQAQIPCMLDTAHVKQGVSLVNQVSTASNIIGPVLAGVLMGWMSIALLVCFGMVCLVAAVMLAYACPFLKRSPAASPGAGTDDSAIAGRGNLFQDMRAAVLFLRNEKPLLLSIVFACLVNAVLAGVNVILPYVVTEQLAWNVAAAGSAEAMGAIGALAGSAFVGLTPGFCTMKRFPAFIALLGFGPLISAMGSFFGFSAAIQFVCLTAGVAWILFWGSTITVVLVSDIQLQCAIDMVGRVLALFYAVATCASPVGQAACGIAIDMFGATVLLVFMATAMELFAVSMALLFKKHTK
ncbi:MAG: MFS transporter [Collinsella bouchesdurhonensis]|nr:MFS transporter [Collinsella bouchesdurhonensis]